MIRCQDCKKFAKVDEVLINGMGMVRVKGSCKHCGYKKQEKIDYDDFEELGISEN